MKCQADAVTVTVELVRLLLRVVVTHQSLVLHIRRGDNTPGRMSGNGRRDGSGSVELNVGFHGASMETTANALAHLRKESQCIFNRIHSIAEDAAFVREVHAHFPDLPLLRTCPSLCPDIRLKHGPQPTCAAALGTAIQRLCVSPKRSRPPAYVTRRLPQSVPTSNLPTAIRTTGALIYADLISTLSP